MIRNNQRYDYACGWHEMIEDKMATIQCLTVRYEDTFCYLIK